MTPADKELAHLAKQPGSMVFGLLIGMVVDYEQTQLEDATAKSRQKRNQAQMSIVAATERRLRRIVQIDLMDEIIRQFQEVEGAEQGRPITLERHPITYRLHLMRQELHL
jgi:hypothetical protein